MTELQRSVTDQYLPGTNIRYAWDSTCITAFKTCPRLYQLSILEGWEPKEPSPHLRFGIEYHRALQDYDISRTSGVGHEDSIHDAVRALMERVADWPQPDRETRAGRYKNVTTLTSLVIDYLDHYVDDPAETYIKADGTPALEVSFRFELDIGPQNSAESQPYVLCGHIDKFVVFNDQLLIKDRKTTSRTLGDYYFKDFEPNNQVSLYIFAGKVILDTMVKGVVIDAAQILLDRPNRFVRGFSYRTQEQIDEWLRDLIPVLDSAENCAITDHWPMNDTACDKFGGCRFREICSKSPSVRERFLHADFVQKPEEERWNPLITR
jgi:hypothetical protein